MHKLFKNIDTISYLKRRMLSFTLLSAIIVTLAISSTAYAASASITFGSESYDSQSGLEFPIGVYLNSDEGTGEFEINLLYDNRRLEYQGGATSVDAENGVITIRGNSTSSGSIRFWLRFRSISGGDAFIKVRDYKVSNTTNTDLLPVTTPRTTPIHISGTDTVGVNVERELEGDDTSSTRSDDGTSDSTDEKESLEKKDEVSILSRAGEIAASSKDFVLANPAASICILISFIALIVIIMILLSYRRNIKKAKNDVEEVFSLDTVETVSTGDGKNIYKSKDSKIVLSPVPKVVDRKRMKDVEGVNYKDLDKPVIRIQDVSMVFNLSNSDASGLKEYLIQKLKRQVEYNKLYALREVSFNIYKGEIVGIIGSNGSGKSTLLKIVSGALKPTKGNVLVDRRKVQILTLGTGFDLELTARENVYLNGAIIGYTKEFLDKHYDEIVEFAELEDFMDQKVKNFSSGMVSRLGFAIATAGDAAEILILDEVLSVGDESFRKKSLARIKEMIHGGSTVLMVSHGMGTIIDNCTKCVWIEKGVLRMIDEPKIVCEAYRNYANGKLK